MVGVQLAAESAADFKETVKPGRALKLDPDPHTVVIIIDIVCTVEILGQPASAADVPLEVGPPFGLVHVGDVVRKARIRKDDIQQLSTDHVVPIEGRKKAPLFQCLGIPATEMIIEPLILEDQVQSGDLFLLCSDGLTDMVNEEIILQILLSNHEMKVAVQMLIQTALDAGGRDNITVILIDIP